MNITLTKSNDINTNRLNYYTAIEEQLDLLWHDIDSGKLGEDAKTGGFYLARKAVKDKFPKS